VDFDTWVDEYEPMHNHLQPDEPWGDFIFETHGDELAFVQSMPKEQVWTLVEGFEGGSYIVEGVRRVNRVGYLVTRKPRLDPDQAFEIAYDDDDEE
jgi:hypothetical protein